MKREKYTRLLTCIGLWFLASFSVYGIFGRQAITPAAFALLVGFLLLFVVFADLMEGK